MSELNLQPNKEFGFLYRTSASPKISLSYWFQVPEFLEELRVLRKDNKSIEDATIFPIMQRIYFDKKNNGDDSFYYGLTRSSLRKISEKLFGTPDEWDMTHQDGVPQEVLSAPKTRRQYIVPSRHLYTIIRNTILSEAFRAKRVFDDVAAYDTAKRVLFLMLRAGYNKDYDEEKNIMYRRTKRIVEVYAEALEGDKKAWQKDYDAYINDEKLFVVKMAARDGQFQEKALTIDELIAMKQQDDSLEDADENL